jgi:ammonia channel protein AmtB
VISYNEALPEEDAPQLLPGDMAWMLTSTALVLFMTPGLAFFYGGMVRAKNVISTLLQSYVAMGIITLVWTIIGYVWPAMTDRPQLLLLRALPASHFTCLSIDRSINSPTSSPPPLPPLTNTASRWPSATR